jgi:general secretion pathway protein K
MPRTTGADGYVTLAVLLVVGLLAAIVSSLLAVSRPSLGLARLGGDEVAAEALLDGGFTTASFLLFGAKQEASDVDKLVLRMRTGEIRLGVTDEGGRIDVNSADSVLLEGLYKAVGATSLSAQAFANRVIDWRDGDGDLKQDGAEGADYTDAGLDYVPSNMPFHAVDEVRLILGLSPSDFGRLEPFLTVFSGTGQIDPLSAPDSVLRAIPGAGRREIQRLQQARRGGQSRARLAELLPEISGFFLSESSGIYRVRVDVTLTQGYSDSAEAVIIAPQGGGSAGYRTVAWSKLPPGARSQ